MWNWSIFKSFALGFVIMGWLYIAGLPERAMWVITIGLSVLIYWIIEEINFVRNAHGSDLEEDESDLEKLKSDINKLKKKT